LCTLNISFIGQVFLLAHSSSRVANYNWKRQLKRFHPLYKNPSALYFVRPAQAVTWRIVATINSSRFTSLIFAHSWRFSVFYSWSKKEGRELSEAENWTASDSTVINPDLSGGWISLQDKYCHKSEPHREYVEWGEKENSWWWAEKMPETCRVLMFFRPCIMV